MTEITNDFQIIDEETEKRFFAIKTDKGEYATNNPYHFTTKIGNATIKNSFKGAVNEAKRIIQRFENKQKKPFEKLYVIELELREKEKEQ